MITTSQSIKYILMALKNSPTLSVITFYKGWNFYDWVLSSFGTLRMIQGMSYKMFRGHPLVIVQNTTKDQESFQSKHQRLALALHYDGRGTCYKCNQHSFQVQLPSKSSVWVNDYKPIIPSFIQSWYKIRFCCWLGMGKIRLVVKACQHLSASNRNIATFNLICLINSHCLWRGSSWAVWNPSLR